MSWFVLVSGGNRNIGLAVAREFADAGDTLKVRVKVIERSWSRVQVFQFRAWSSVEGAGITRNGLPQTGEQDLEAGIASHLAGVVRVAKHAALGMRSWHWSRPLFISWATAK